MGSSCSTWFANSAGSISEKSILSTNGSSRCCHATVSARGAAGRMESKRRVPRPKSLGGAARSGDRSSPASGACAQPQWRHAAQRAAGSWCIESSSSSSCRVPGESPKKALPEKKSLAVYARNNASRHTAAAAGFGVQEHSCSRQQSAGSTSSSEHTKATPSTSSTASAFARLVRPAKPQLRAASSSSSIRRPCAAATTSGSAAMVSWSGSR
mmetsp:Transcript_107663/g.304563  ORF Transcript_107663/g.304563 Transcript_107663/m.304563 type:complete len:212 (-) Transcript_107663:361-996(-)